MPERQVHCVGLLPSCLICLSIASHCQSRPQFQRQLFQLPGLFLMRAFSENAIPCPWAGEWHAMARLERKPLSLSCMTPDNQCVT